MFGQMFIPKHMAGPISFKLLKLKQWGAVQGPLTSPREGQRQQERSGQMDAFLSASLATVMAGKSFQSACKMLAQGNSLNCGMARLCPRAYWMDWIAVLQKKLPVSNPAGSSSCPTVQCYEACPFLKVLPGSHCVDPFSHSRVTSSSAHQLTSWDTELIFSTLISYHSSAEAQILAGCTHSLPTWEGNELGQNLQEWDHAASPRDSNLLWLSRQQWWLVALAYTTPGLTPKFVKT